MTDSLRGEAWRFLCAAFPERQIYIRSEGRVQFFTFGSLMQTILAGITLAFLGWVAFTSVNVVFKDRIIATKDKRFQQMQTSYETRVSDLQLAYDELNGALVNAADSFHAKANELEIKHKTLNDLIQRKQALQNVVGNGAVGPNTAAVVAVTPPAPEPVATRGPVGDSVGESEGDASIGPPAKAGSALPAPSTNLPVTNIPGSSPAAGAGSPTLRQAPAAGPRSTRSSFLEGAVEKLASVFTRKRATSPAILTHPLVKQVAMEEARLDRLKAADGALTTDAEQSVADEIAHLQGAIHVAGIDPNALVSRVAGTAAEGGPLIPLSGSAISGVQDASFSDAVTRITVDLDTLSNVVNAMHSVPLTVPVQGPEFGISSGFGARVDPFTKRLAFHAGLDFTGPWGAIIHATAPGIVVYAGPRGPYGNAVEIDHGLGIRTRYGHLSAILVQPGTKVDKGTPVGRLGSSGRSTGPHVHYEVWFDDVVRDPSKFIEAGHYVLKE